MSINIFLVYSNNLGRLRSLPENAGHLLPAGDIHRPSDTTPSVYKKTLSPNSEFFKRSSVPAKVCFTNKIILIRNRISS